MPRYSLKRVPYLQRWFDCCSSIEIDQIVVTRSGRCPASRPRGRSGRSELLVMRMAIKVATVWYVGQEETVGPKLDKNGSLVGRGRNCIPTYHTKPYHASHFIPHVSCIMIHVSYITYHASHIIYSRSRLSAYQPRNHILYLAYHFHAWYTAKFITYRSKHISSSISCHRKGHTAWSYYLAYHDMKEDPYCLF